MSHYTYTQKLESLWNQAAEQYNQGNKDYKTYFSDTDIAFMASIGMRPHEMYDFVDDSIRYGSPDFTTMVIIQDVRRHFFLSVQEKIISSKIVTADELPAKTDKIQGISWLPRIIAKAYAKLRGELHEDLMFGCAGDRNFLEKHDLHPADLLRAAWKHPGDPESIAKWLIRRK